MSVMLNFIGHIRTPYQSISDCPNNIQLGGPLCQLNLDPDHQDGLQGLVVGQKILILYWLGEKSESLRESRSNRGGWEKGVFALRTPHRPNPIGVAVLPIEKLESGQITVRGLDCLDNTRLVDIKPAIYQEAVGHC